MNSIGILFEKSHGRGAGEEAIKSLRAFFTSVSTSTEEEYFESPFQKVKNASKCIQDDAT